jgi:hypothetical protein
MKRKYIHEKEISTVACFLCITVTAELNQVRNSWDIRDKPFFGDLGINAGCSSD